MARSLSLLPNKIKKAKETTAFYKFQNKNDVLPNLKFVVLVYGKMMGRRHLRFKRGS